MERVNMEGLTNETSKYASNSPFPATTDCVPCLHYAEMHSRVPNANHLGILETTPPVIAKRRKIGFSLSRLSVQQQGLTDFRDFRARQLLELLQPEGFLK